MLIRRTIAAMNKQINKLEEQKKVYVEAGKQAKQKGLTAQYNLALSGLRMTLTQQRRVYEMKLNFEITAQMKDMTQMTSAFLKGMGSLSKDMMKLTKEKDFIKVEKQFNEAMTSIELQAEHLESFMDETQSAFAMGAPGDEETNKELDALITNEASMDGLTTDSEIEKELEILKKKMSQ
jgi:tetraacyldisaccharide-1-P 4'-kinase